MFARCLRSTWREIERRNPKCSHDLISGKPANTMPLQQSFDASARQLAGRRGHWSYLNQIPQPRILRSSTELEQLRKVTMQLFAKLIDKPTVVLNKIILKPGQFT